MPEVWEHLIAYSGRMLAGSQTRRAPPLSVELHECYCSSKEHGTNGKSQCKGLPCRAHFLALEFLALEFLVEPFDVGKHVLEAVSGVRHRDRPPAARESRGATVRTVKETTRLARFGSARQCEQPSYPT